ncbi:exosortase/archaeosortase family protein [bacterium]|nr:MAG: exosortase/archaeosortase family protein [bacterium]
MNEVAHIEAGPIERPKERFRLPDIDWISIVRSPYFVPGVLVALALGAAYWDLVRTLPELWMNNEYYSHGVLVPLISGYIIYRWWPRIKDTPVRTAYWAIVPLLFCLLCAVVAYLAETATISSLAFVGTIWSGVLLVAGWGWAKNLALPVAYLLFSLPTFGPMIEEYTNPAQVISTKAAFALLNIAGFQPISPSGTTIYLNHFTLDVGVPCSGLKLIVALGSFVVFFMAVGRLKWWSNAALIAITLPLAILFNGLRIAMIGIVGEMYGDAAGHQFHDYSGYITLILCFFVLFKIVRLLGWKD